MKLAIGFSLIIVLGCLSCVNLGGKRVRGNGNLSKMEHTVSTFDDVEVHGALDVYVTQAALKPVVVEADENLQKYIIVEQEGDKVIVKTKRGYNLKPSKKIKIHVTSPQFSRLDVSGACSIISETPIRSDDELSMHVSGSGDINVEADAPKVETEISGSGEVKMKGNTRDFKVSISGAGKARCYEMLSENTEIDISGAASAEVYASVRLKASVSGAGSVKYKGAASQVDKHISGAGSVKQVN